MSIIVEASTSGLSGCEERAFGVDLHRSHGHIIKRSSFEAPFCLGTAPVCVLDCPSYKIEALEANREFQELVKKVGIVQGL